MLQNRKLLPLLLVVFLLLPSVVGFQFYCHRLERAGKIVKEIVFQDGERLNEGSPIVLSTNKSSLQCYWRAQEEIKYKIKWSGNFTFNGRISDSPPVLNITTKGYVPAKLSKFTLLMPECADEREFPSSKSSQNISHNSHNVVIHFHRRGMRRDSARSSVDLVLKRECGGGGNPSCIPGFTGKDCRKRVLEFIERPKHSKLSCGETAVFMCSASGVPLPTISWYRYNQSIPATNESRFRIVQSSHVISTLQSSIAQDDDKAASSTLYLYQIHQGDHGYYTCVIRNKHGFLMDHAFLAPPPSSSCNLHTRGYSHDTV